MLVSLAHLNVEQERLLPKVDLHSAQAITARGERKDIRSTRFVEACVSRHMNSSGG